MERNTAVMVVLGILIVMSLMQAYQLTSLKAKVSESGVTARSSASVIPMQSGSPAGEPSSLDDLSAMAGGC